MSRLGHLGGPPKTRNQTQNASLRKRVQSLASAAVAASLDQGKLSVFPGGRWAAVAWCAVRGRLRACRRLRAGSGGLEGRLELQLLSSTGRPSNTILPKYSAECSGTAGRPSVRSVRGGEGKKVSEASAAQS